MLAQAEHDADASAVLLTTSKRLASAVSKEIDRQLESLPTAVVARQADRQEFRRLCSCDSLDEAVEISNRFRARASEYSG